MLPCSTYTTLSRCLKDSFKNSPDIEIVEISQIFALFLLVGAFLGKSARLLQWLVFFLFFFVRLQSHPDWATFLTIETTKTTSIRGQVRSAKITAKGSPLSYFTILP